MSEQDLMAHSTYLVVSSDIQTYACPRYEVQGACREAEGREGVESRQIIDCVDRNGAIPTHCFWSPKTWLHNRNHKNARALFSLVNTA